MKLLTFFIDDMDINNIGLDDNDDNDNDDLETMIHVRLVTWCNEYKQCNAFKRKLNKVMMRVA